MSKQRKILQNQKEKIMFLNLTKNQNSNDERYVQKNTNLDTKIHRITKKITKSQTIRTYIYNDIQKHRDMRNVKHGHKNIHTQEYIYRHLASLTCISHKTVHKLTIL